MNWRRGLFNLSLGVFALAAPRAGFPLEGFPGAIWGNATHDSTGPAGLGTMGWVKQGIDWVTLPGDIMLNTFVSYNYRLRRKKRLYYNTDGPSAGFELKRFPLTLGIDYYEEQFRELERTSYNTEVYLSWYLKWGPWENFPISSWGKLVQDTSGLTGSSALGWVKQSAVLGEWPGGSVSSVFVQYSYRGRTKERRFYDAQGPAVGIECDMSFLTLGVSRSWQSFPFEQGWLENTQFYLNWYYPWDL